MMRYFYISLRLFWFCFAIVMTFALPSTIAERRNHWIQFEENKISTRGDVTGTQYHSICRKNEPSCIPIVSFMHNEQQIDVPDYTVRTYSGYALGTSVSILYDPSSPENAYIYTGDQSLREHAQLETLIFSILWIFSFILLFLMTKEYVYLPFINKG